MLLFLNLKRESLKNDLLHWMISSGLFNETIFLLTKNSPIKKIQSANTEQCSNVLLTLFIEDAHGLIN